MELVTLDFNFTFLQKSFLACIVYCKTYNKPFFSSSFQDTTTPFPFLKAYIIFLIVFNLAIEKRHLVIMQPLCIHLSMARIFCLWTTLISSKSWTFFFQVSQILLQLHVMHQILQHFPTPTLIGFSIFPYFKGISILWICRILCRI
jgi:hypothetical protein